MQFISPFVLVFPPIIFVVIVDLQELFVYFKYYSIFFYQKYYSPNLSVTYYEFNVLDITSAII